ncbi:MAG: M23 family metallopeptidase [Lachnospiraceae bacterium]|nr:M23 family metallopeptidase [Lachnospiraceae bacterium]
MEETTAKKKHSKYAVMVVKEHEEGTITTHTIGTTLCEAILIAVFVLFAFFVCKLIYDSITMKKLRADLVEQMAMVNNLTDENETLSVENDTLTAKVTVLSDTVSKKTATEDALSQEEIENAIPKGFPLSSGTTTIDYSEMGGHPIAKLTASSGVNIISAGTGTVLSVEDDAEYGNRIIIDHGNGYKSIYRNKGEVLVKVGETLGKGYILFSVSGKNTDIGYQIMLNDEYVDPKDVIQIDG